METSPEVSVVAAPAKDELASSPVAAIRQTGDFINAEMAFMG